MKIITVFKTHFDIGFTDLSKNVLERYSSNMLEDVLDVCESTQSHDKGQRFVWTMSAWPLYQTLMGASPKNLIRAESLIKNDQLYWHALPFTIHTEFAGVEELIRGLKYSKLLSDKYNKPYPIAAKMTDVPGHTYYLVSLLAKAGIKFLQLGCNPASTPPKLPQLFWWEAPDGERVLTFYNSTYGSSILPPSNWKYSVWLNMNQTNDNVGPQDKNIINYLNEQKGDDNELFIGTLDDFYYELAKNDLSDLPVIKKDLADTWIHGAGTYPKETGVIRSLRERLITLEKFYLYINQTKSYNNKNIEKLLAEAYDHIILFDEHTWGMDIKTHLGSDIVYDNEEFLKRRSTEKYLKVEQSWNEQRERVYNAEKNLQQILDILNKDIDADYDKIKIFNGKTDNFSGVIEITKYLNKLENTTKVFDKYYAEVKSLPSFTLIDLQTVKKEYNSFEEENYYCLSNQKLSLTVDKKMGTIALNDFRGNKLVSEGLIDYNIANMQNITDYQRKYLTRFYAWAIFDFGRVNYPEFEEEHFKPIKADVIMKDNQIHVKHYFDARAAKKFGMASTVETIYTMFSDRLKISIKMIDKPATTYVESCNFRLGTDAESIIINKTGTLVNPEKDVAENANNVLYCMEKHIKFKTKENKITLISYDVPLVSIGEDMLFNYKGKYREDNNKNLFFNLFNTMWGTNFPQWIEGTFLFEFDILLNEEEKNITTPNQIMLIDYKIDGFDKLLRIENAELFSVKKLDNGFILRIREITNNSKKAVLKGSMIKGNIYNIDLYERKQQILVADNNQLIVNLNPCEIKSVFIESNC